MMNAECALVVGVGERQGIGAAVAALLAEKGLHVYVVGRTAEKLNARVREIRAKGGNADALIADSTSETEVRALFTHIQQTNQVLKVVVYNTGRNIPSPFLKADVHLLEGHWQRCVLGAFVVAQEALKMMLAQESEQGVRGTLIFTGASASLRGKPMFAGFSASKGALRAMAQSIAREFGPQGVHVAHVVIDGLVNGAIVREFGPLGRLLIKRKGNAGALLPDEVAKSFWMLHQQSPTAWTHELDLRPYREGF
jgi:NAD(P)-dependent dehydrogenase (short-subunit alcohol dehydrogenase family)